MSDLKQAKNILRKKIQEEKIRKKDEEIKVLSDEVFSVVEITGVFQSAKRILIYNSLSDEVDTSSFVEKWQSEKEFYLPVIENDRLVVRKLSDQTEFTRSQLGVLEPIGENLEEVGKLNLIIVPGVAFDRNKNRLGRGKGYYDRFLSEIKVPTMGVCFDFQLLDQIPVDQHDIKMNYLVSENDFIW